VNCDVIRRDGSEWHCLSQKSDATTEIHLADLEGSLIVPTYCTPIYSFLELDSIICLGVTTLFLSLRNF
jgi:hypothetical protein